MKFSILQPQSLDLVSQLPFQLSVFGLSFGLEILKLPLQLLDLVLILNRPFIDLIPQVFIFSVQTSIRILKHLDGVILVGR